MTIAVTSPPASPPARLPAPSVPPRGFPWRWAVALGIAGLFATLLAVRRFVGAHGPTSVGP